MQVLHLFVLLASISPFSEDSATDQATQLVAWNNPYIIENVLIDGQGSGNAIEIADSSVYFIIRNCTIFNSGTGWEYPGFILEDVKAKSSKALTELFKIKKKLVKALYKVDIQIVR